jgi:hypothetical protein
MLSSDYMYSDGCISLAFEEDKEGCSLSWRMK